MTEKATTVQFYFSRILSADEIKRLKALAESIDTMMDTHIEDLNVFDM